MKIAIMSRWNATCGVSLHAELIARKWVKLGNEVTVFAPTIDSANADWHHRKIDVEDESWVIRCYEESGSLGGGRIDVKEILNYDFEVFVVEAYSRLPLGKLGELIDAIRGKAKTIAIVHVGSKNEIDPIVRLKFDALVVFDERYVNELFSGYPLTVREKVYIIPYPCVEPLNVKPKNPPFTRGKIVFFSFGRQPHEEYRDYITAVRRLRTTYSNIVYWIIRSNSPLEVSEPWIVQWVGRPPLKRLYSYIKASNLHLLPKGNTRRVVVSSTLFQTLGSLVPIIAPNTRYFESIPTDDRGIGPMVKYNSVDDLVEKMISLLEDRRLRQKVINMAKEYVSKNSSTNIAKQYIRLFNTIA